MANIYKRWLCEESLKTPLLATHFNIYLNLETSLHSIITVICMDPHSPNKLFATKYCFLMRSCLEIIRVSFSLFLYFSFLFLLFYVIINFYKNYFVIIMLLYFFFFMTIIFIFSCSAMFRDVPECSGMFLNVPCSWFYRRPKINCA